MDAMLTHVESRMLDPHFHSGDPFWGGDTTLHEVSVTDGDRSCVGLVVVPRGEGFISASQIARYIKERYASADEFGSALSTLGAGLKPRAWLPIEPGY